VVRPTSGKIREALRAILRDVYPGSRVLDLFAGTGSLGLDALQEGADHCTFVEEDRPLALKLRGHGRVVVGRLPRALDQLTGPFDLVLADPPYGSAAGPATVALLAPFLSPGALVVVEHHHKDAFEDSCGALRRSELRRYGETAISLYRGEA
jgi:16S rRNA (guanine966-N2)-methyltransferase